MRIVVSAPMQPVGKVAIGRVRSRWALAAFLGGLAGLVAVMVVRPGDTVVAVLCGVVAMAGLVQRLLPWQLTGRPPARSTRYDWEITELGVTGWTETEAMSFAWQGVRRVQVRADAFVLRIERSRAVGIPRAAFSPAQDGELLRFLGRDSGRTQI